MVASQPPYLHTLHFLLSSKLPWCHRFSGNRSCFRSSRQHYLLLHCLLAEVIRGCLLPPRHLSFDHHFNHHSGLCSQLLCRLDSHLSSVLSHLHCLNLVAHLLLPLEQQQEGLQRQQEQEQEHSQQQDYLLNLMISKLHHPPVSLDHYHHLCFQHPKHHRQRLLHHHLLCQLVQVNPYCQHSWFRQLVLSSLDHAFWESSHLRLHWI